jgi:hypothetical protein
VYRKDYKAVLWLRRLYAGLNTEARIQSVADPCGICGGQSGTEILFSPKDFHVSPGIISTNAVCSFIRPLPTLNTRNPSSWQYL